MSNDDLMVKIKADIRSLQSGLRQAAREADIAGKKMQEGIGRSGATAALEGIRGGASSAASALGGLRGTIATLGVAKLSKDALAAAVGFDSLQASLTVVLGSSEATAAAIADMRAQAERLGVNVVTLTQGFSKFAAAANGTALEGAAARDVFLSVNEAAARMGLSTEQTEGALRALEQMMSKGTVQAEELRGQLGERIPGAFNMAARAMGVTTQELNDLLKQGKVVSDDFLPKFAQELRNTFSTAETTRIETMRAEFQRLQNVLTEIKIEVGTPLARAFASAGKEFLQFGTFVGEAVARAQGYRDVPFEKEIEDIQKLIQTMNRNPLTLITPQGQQALDDQIRKLEELKQKQGEYWAEASKAPKSRDQTASASAPTASPPVLSDKDSKAAEQEEKRRQAALKAIQDANRKIVESVRERVADETALENMRYSAQRATLEAINDQTVVSTEEKNRLLTQLEAKHAVTLAGITAQRGADIEAALERDRAAVLERERMLDELAAYTGEVEAQARFRAEEDYLYRLDLLAQFSEDELALIGERNELREQIERDHWARLGEIQADALTAQFSFTKFAKTKEQSFLATLGDKSLAMWAGQSKKMFELNKALNLGNTIMATSEAIMDTYANGGGLFAHAQAALMASIGLAHINAIKNAKFGGGSSPPVTGAAAAGGGVVGDTNAPGASQQVPQISLTLVGGQFSQQQVRDLINQINEAYRDGAPRR